MIDDRSTEHGSPDPDDPVPYPRDGTGEGMPWAVTPGGHAAALVAAYRQAQTMADELADAFTRAGLGGDMLTLTAAVDDAGRPAVRSTITLPGARRLAAWMSAGGRLPAGDPSSPGPPGHPRGGAGGAGSTGGGPCPHAA